MCYDSGCSPLLLTAQVWIQSQGSLCAIFCEYSETYSSATALVSAASFCSMIAAFSYTIRDWYNRPQYQGTLSYLIRIASYSDHSSNTAVGSSDYAMLGRTVLQNLCGRNLQTYKHPSSLPPHCLKCIHFWTLTLIVLMWRIG